MYRAHWQQAGGSISIIEFEVDPPDSNYLKQKLGELCGSSFWVFLSQRFQLLDPENEQYAAEIEKSIYNVGLANQDAGNGFRYHTVLEGEKEKATHENTCCEGQGTRLIGSLPEHIYSMASDGLYLHLYEPLDGEVAAGRAGDDAFHRGRSSRSTTSWRERSMPPRPPRPGFAFACLRGPSARWESR